MSSGLQNDQKTKILEFCLVCFLTPNDEDVVKIVSTALSYNKVYSISYVQYITRCLDYEDKCKHALFSVSSDCSSEVTKQVYDKFEMLTSQSHGYCGVKTLNADRGPKNRLGIFHLTGRSSNAVLQQIKHAEEVAKNWSSPRRTHAKLKQYK